MRWKSLIIVSRVRLHTLPPFGIDGPHRAPYHKRMAKHILAGVGIALVVLGMVIPAGPNVYIIGAGACVIGAAHFA